MIDLEGLRLVVEHNERGADTAKAVLEAPVMTVDGTFRTSTVIYGPGKWDHFYDGQTWNLEPGQYALVRISEQASGEEGTGN